MVLSQEAERGIKLKGSLEGGGGVARGLQKGRGDSLFVQGRVKATDFDGEAGRVRGREVSKRSDTTPPVRRDALSGRKRRRAVGLMGGRKRRPDSWVVEQKAISMDEASLWVDCEEEGPVAEITELAAEEHPLFCRSEMKNQHTARGAAVGRIREELDGSDEGEEFTEEDADEVVNDGMAAREVMRAEGKASEIVEGKPETSSDGL